MFPNRAAAKRLRIESTIPLLTGDRIRDWRYHDPDVAIWVYDNNCQLIPLERSPEIGKLLWRSKTRLSRRKRFGVPMLERGLTWYEWQELYADKLQTPLSIAFAFVATHNHFVLDRGEKVFKQSAPVIKLPAGATENDHLRLLALLNSSTACFWMKQVTSCKGLGGQGGGIKPEDWHRAYEFDSTKLLRFPVPAGAAADEQLLALAKMMSALSEQASRCQPMAIVGSVPSKQLLDRARAILEDMVAQMVWVQEEIDWLVYSMYGLCDYEKAAEQDMRRGLHPEQRPAEIVFKDGLTNSESIFYQVHRHRGVDTLRDLSVSMRSRISERIKLINTKPELGLMETLNYKRRWQFESWDARQEQALRSWLLDRLEAPALWSAPRLTTAAALADRMREDSEFLQVAELYTGHPDFDVADLVGRLVEDESVPLLPVLRYKLSGLRKREAWEHTWDLQRREDAIDARAELPATDPRHLTAEAAVALKAAEMGPIPVPLRYTAADFRNSTWWRLRGKLDVPKERFVSLPYCEREADPSLVIGWAGWNELEQSRAVAEYFLRMRQQEGWPAERLTPMLGALLELLPWVRQYHNAPDPEFGTGMGDDFERFIEEEARDLSLTRESILHWTPPDGRTRRSRRRKTST